MSNQINIPTSVFVFPMMYSRCMCLTRLPHQALDGHAAFHRPIIHRRDLWPEPFREEPASGIETQDRFLQGVGRKLWDTQVRPPQGPLDCGSDHLRATITQELK